jgi:hypothetical protein
MKHKALEPADAPELPSELDMGPAEAVDPPADEEEYSVAAAEEAAAEAGLPMGGINSPLLEVLTGANGNSV